MHITVSDPSVWPLEVGETKEYLQIDHRSDDDFIRILIRAATRAAEHYTNRKFITQTVTLITDSHESFSPLALPYPPLITLTSFEQYDSEGNLSTVDSSLYYVLGTNPARIIAKDQGWSLQRRYGALKIVYTAGYGAAAASVPQDIRQAVKMIVGDMWAHSGHASSDILVEAPVPFPARVLLQPYKVLV